MRTRKEKKVSDTVEVIEGVTVCVYVCVCARERGKDDRNQAPTLPPLKQKQKPTTCILSLPLFLPFARFGRYEDGAQHTGGREEVRTNKEGGSKEASRMREEELPHRDPDVHAEGRRERGRLVAARELGVVNLRDRRWYECFKGGARHLSTHARPCTHVHLRARTHKKRRGWLDDDTISLVCPAHKI